MECKGRRDTLSVREKRQVECKGRRDRWSVRGEETGGV